MTIDLDRLLDESQVAPLLGVSVKTLQAYRLRGAGPPFVKLSPAADAASGAVRYRPADVEAFRARRETLTASAMPSRGFRL